MSKIILSEKPGPIGIFDSGYGGLTILKHIRSAMPEYDFMYLGDNARTPYGTRSFQVVYEFTLQCVTKLFEMGCHLVILACNTASAKALRTIQQIDLPRLDATRRVLGIIRPTVESIGELTQSRHVGLLPDITVTGESCPIWVPLVESGESQSDGADFFVKQHIDNLLRKDSEIDTIILGCTHYPLLLDKIRKYVPEGIRIVSQGEYVASSLKLYMERHPEMDARCTKEGTCRYYTTESLDTFLPNASIFLNSAVDADSITL